MTATSLVVAREPEHAHLPSTVAEIESALTILAESAATWGATGLAERVALLDALLDDTLAVAAGWAEASAKAARMPEGPVCGEAWTLGPTATLRCIRQYRDTLKELHETGTLDPGPVSALPDGRIAVEVFPRTRFDRLLFAGHHAEVWMEPGVTAANVADTMARPYRGEAAAPGVALVLGAGNVSAIATTDVLHMLLVENQVVLLKMNPVNEHVGPFVEQAFRALVSRGFLRVVYGGADEGGMLAEHPRVERIHLTGSDRTHDAIVFGPGEEGQRRRRSRVVRNARRVSCELGNVTPFIVVPGPWNRRDVSIQGEALAAQVTTNVGFNCVTGRLIINRSGWACSRYLMEAVRDHLRQAPQRHPYYPGARQRWERFVETYPQAECFGSREGEDVPYTLVAGLDAKQTDQLAFREEAFAPIIAETSIAAGSKADYLAQAVELCNEHLWGTLAAHILIHPETFDEPGMAEAMERAVRDLRYGTVAINTWAALSFTLMDTPWGAAPGHEPWDIQSGTGFVHNTRMFERPEKTVIRGPFRPLVKPIWFPSHRSAHRLMPRLTAFEAEPTWGQLPGIAWQALRG